MKKLSKILVISLLALVMVLTLAACSGAPGYVKNPPEDPADLVKQLKEDGWEAYDATVLKLGMIMASKYNVKEEDFDSLKDSDKIVWEMVFVTYYATEDLAKAAKSAADTSASKDKDKAPKGISYSYSISQSGKTVSVYVKMSGSYKDMQAAFDIYD